MRAHFLILIPLILFLISCGSDDPFSFQDDFSTVPEPFSIQGVTPDTTDSGLIIYVLEEGNGELTAQIRDQVRILFTGRSIDGTVFESTYKNGSTNPLIYTVAGITFTEGFQEGVLNMREGGKRVLVVPPELGYLNIPVQDPDILPIRRDTLVFDIELQSVVF